MSLPDWELWPVRTCGVVPEGGQKSCGEHRASGVSLLCGQWLPALRVINTNPSQNARWPSCISWYSSC